jgi:hypothetical protein
MGCRAVGMQVSGTLSPRCPLTLTTSPTHAAAYRPHPGTTLGRGSARTPPAPAPDPAPAPALPVRAFEFGGDEAAVGDVAVESWTPTTVP